VTDGATPAGERMPIPMGVIAETGETRPELGERALEHLVPDDATAMGPTAGRRAMAFVEDPMNLSQAGWSILFASDADPAVVEAMTPLIEWRRGQVNDERAFKVFTGSSGVGAGETAQHWAAGRGISLSAPVMPRRGVPYYLLIIGSPARIPIEFQAQLDLQRAVGRLHFDAAADYAGYVEHLIAYEQGSTPPQSKRAAVWMPRNPMDLATAMLAGSVLPEFRGESAPGDGALGARQGFDVTTLEGDRATKAQLTSLIRGDNGDPPALLFTGSHGAEWRPDSPDLQRERQGALVTQEWSRGRPLTDDCCFAASDLPANARIQGLVMFLFACFGGGCPVSDTYYFGPGGSRLPLAAEPMTARLPQVLLRQGAVAVIAHVDRAFSYAFEDVLGTPQAQLLRLPLEELLSGRRVGLAMEPLNQQWSALAAQLGVLLGGAAAEPPPRRAAIANLFIARDDARNYIVLGDPAARLRTESMIATTPG
jgi:hypothetical protein